MIPTKLFKNIARAFCFIRTFLFSTYCKYSGQKVEIFQFNYQPSSLSKLIVFTPHTISLLGMKKAGLH